jgi:hypothetical protein
VPPYSPAFNPIEKAFANLKALLRKAAARTVDGLSPSIGRLLDIFTPIECANDFSACGYDPDRKDSALARISHQGRCIGPGNLTKLFWKNDLPDSTAGSDADTVYL